MSDVKRASLDELLDFANKVRAAGGGNPLDALMPAVPEDPTQCLIAKNLNFNCHVDGGPGRNDEVVNGKPPKEGGWVMTLDDRSTRDKIAKGLDLEPLDWREFVGWTTDRKTGRLEPIKVTKDRYSVHLPAEIGAVARDFDGWAVAIDWDWDEDAEDDVHIISETADDEDKARLAEFWPYIEESAKEAYANASFVNEKGELVL